ncbi:Universal stress protein A [Quillaja saponaria]|uniref:Universal stress protein A n=1 Tax=Quillaja saponaria TaxID=32244 RepID=A0AAD7QAC9_QUISA|nr:Universal stress protein A [Quillaja saponaria]
MAEVTVKERRILVAVDEGEESMYALSWCLNNVISNDKNSKDTLILLYAKPPRTVCPNQASLDGTATTTCRRELYQQEGYLFSNDIVASMERYGKQVADCVIGKAKKMCKDLHHDVKVETRVESGDPRGVICEMADKLAAHVLVMGTHGYGFIKRALLGSVSNHCAQNVKCPVLIVKKPKTSTACFDSEEAKKTSAAGNKLI